MTLSDRTCISGFCLIGGAMLIWGVIGGLVAISEGPMDAMCGVMALLDIMAFAWWVLCMVYGNGK